MNKHTLGPWEMDSEEKYIYPEIKPNQDRYVHHVARVTNCEEAHANACLIAAAPEMYELLDRINHGDMEALNSVRDLLTKINGESS